MITVATIASGPMGLVWDLAKQTWEPYCKRHGYDLVCWHNLPAPGLAPSWNKCLMVSLLLKATKNPVWWIDSDMTVVKPLTPLEQGFSHAPLRVSCDWNGVCCGLFRAEPYPWTIDFLNFLPSLGDVRDPDQFGKGMGVKWEQNALKALIRDFPSVENNVRRLPQEWVNDNPQNPLPTDFIWHFGARPIPVRIRMIRERHPELLWTTPNIESKIS